MSPKPKRDQPMPSAVKALAAATTSAMAHSADVMAKMDAAATPEEFAARVAESAMALCGLSKEVDKFAATRNELERVAEVSRAKATWLNLRAKAIEDMIATADAHVLAEIKAQPDMPLSGDAYGVKAINNGGVEALRIMLAREDGSNPVREHVHFSKVVDSAFAFTADLPQKFLIEENIVRLNTDAIRIALAAGDEIKWARLERGQRIAIKDL